MHTFIVRELGLFTRTYFYAIFISSRPPVISDVRKAFLIFASEAVLG